MDERRAKEEVEAGAGASTGVDDAAGIDGAGVKEEVSLEEARVEGAGIEGGGTDVISPCDVLRFMSFEKKVERGGRWDMAGEMTGILGEVRLEGKGVE